MLIPDENIDREIFKQLAATDSSEPPFIEIDTDLEKFGDSAFEKAVFQGVKIPEGVKSLGKRVFANCTNLTLVELPDGLNEIGDEAFANCTALKRIVIPPQVKDVGDNLFSGCTRLKKIFCRAGANFVNKLQAGNGAEIIPYYRFKLPDGVTIESKPIFKTGKLNYFAEMIHLKNKNSTDPVKVEIQQPKTFPAKGYTFTFDGVDTFTVTEDANKIILDAAVSVDAQEIAVDAEIDLAREKIMLDATVSVDAQKIAVDAEIDLANIIDRGTCGYNVTWTLYEDGTFVVSGTGDMQNYYHYDTPGPWRDYRDSIKKVVIKDGVTSVGKLAFMNCKQLTDAKISDSVTRIYGDAFCGCESLTNMTVPASVKMFGDYVFGYCDKLENVTFFCDLDKIPAGTFNSCRSLKSVRLPDGITEIAKAAFKSCTSLTGVEIPNGVTIIDHEAFYNCKSLSSVRLPAPLSKIGDRAFNDCKRLTSATVEKILSNNITEIGKCAFENCTGLTGNITIPPSVTKIGYGVFNGCINLKKIYYHYIPRQRHETLKKKLTTGGNTKLHELP